MGHISCISSLLNTHLCLCVSIHERLPGSVSLLCLTHSTVITQKNVIGLQALCHCLALSIKLTTIPNPPIAHAEQLLSATVSWQRGENEHSLPFFNKLVRKRHKNLLSLPACAHSCVSFLFPCVFSSLSSSLAALGCSPVSLKPISSITEIIFLRGHVFVQWDWISQLSEAVENRGGGGGWEGCKSLCVCAFSVCALCSLAAHGCFLINASLSWRSHKERGGDRMEALHWPRWAIWGQCSLRVLGKHTGRAHTSVLTKGWC